MKKMHFSFSILKGKHI